MKQKRNKKPTLKDIEAVVSSLILDVRNLSSAFHSYIEYNKDGEKWIKWLDKKVNTKNKEK